MSDFHDRADAVLGTEEGRIRWPYGMSSPHPGEKRKDPKKYEQRLLEQRAKQEAMVSWAEQHGLRYSEAGCCPYWLQGKVSRRCRPYGPSADKCTRYGTGADKDWLDHVVGWLKDGRPAVLTSAPYCLERITEAPQRFKFWQQEDSRLRVAIGPGWYGFDTSQVIVWRADRITTVEPAALTLDGDIE
jgi:hypothetical protein